jgi:putative ubiquitin-RnfH superfamily antitoxin RatB of RatAB toxin-antitoxin module
MGRAELQVEVVYCPAPGINDFTQLKLNEGATVADAVQASGVLQRHALAAEGLKLGVWSKPREASSLLRHRDRIEIYRPLTVDPKEARRLRYKRHRDKAASAAPAEER